MCGSDIAVIRGVREEVAEALGEIGDPAAVQVLGEALGDESRDVAEAAALESLADAGTGPALDALLRAAQSGDGRVRRAVARALGRD